MVAVGSQTAYTTSGTRQVFTDGLPASGDGSNNTVEANMRNLTINKVTFRRVAWREIW